MSSDLVFYDNENFDEYINRISSNQGVASPFAEKGGYMAGSLPGGKCPVVGEHSAMLEKEACTKAVDELSTVELKQYAQRSKEAEHRISVLTEVISSLMNENKSIEGKAKMQELKSNTDHQLKNEASPITVLKQLLLSSITTTSVIACIDAATTIGDHARTEEGRSNLTCNPKNDDESTKSRTLIQTLCQILSMTENESLDTGLFLTLKKQVIRAIGNLCYDHDPNRRIVVDCNGIRGMVDLGKHLSDLGILRNVCGALGNLCEGEKFQNMIMNAGGIDILVKGLTLATDVMSKHPDTSTESVCHIVLNGFGRLAEMSITHENMISYVKMVIRLGMVIKASSIPNDPLLAKVLDILSEFTREKKKALVDGEVVPFLISLLCPVHRDISEIQVECIRILCHVVPQCPPTTVVSIISNVLILIAPLSSCNDQTHVLSLPKSVKQEAIGALATLAAEPRIADHLLNNGLPHIIMCAESEDKMMRLKSLATMQVLAREEQCDRLFGNPRIVEVLTAALQHIDTCAHALQVVRNLSLRTSLKLSIAKCALNPILGLLVGRSELTPSADASVPTKCAPIASAIPVVRHLLAIPRKYKTKEEETKIDAIKIKIADQVTAYAEGAVLKHLTQLAESGESLREKNIRFEAGRTMCELCRSKSSREFFWGMNSSVQTIKNVILLMLQMIQTPYAILWHEASQALMYLTDSHIKSFWEITTRDIKDIQEKNTKDIEHTKEEKEDKDTENRKGEDDGKEREKLRRKDASFLLYYAITQLLAQLNTIDNQKEGGPKIEGVSVSQIAYFSVQAVHSILLQTPLRPPTIHATQLTQNLKKITETYLNISCASSTQIVETSRIVLHLLK